MVITHWNVATWSVSVFKEILRILYTCGTTVIVKNLLVNSLFETVVVRAG